MRYDTDGNFIDTFASGNGLDNPDGLIFGSDGHLYVASEGNDKIFRFDGITGEFIDVFASSPDVNDPTALDFAPDGRVYVANSNMVLSV